MTKQIEDTLGLPRLADALKEVQGDDAPVLFDEEGNPIVESPELVEMTKALEQSHALEQSFRDPDGTIEHAAEMDEIYTAAMRAHKDIIDLGFNIEAKHAGTMFEPSARYLEIALKASQSKETTRKKALELRMKREKLDADLKAMRANEDEAVIDGDAPVSGRLMDRNDVMKMKKAELEASRAKDKK